mgnify:CR=1 FL=1
MSSRNFGSLGGVLLALLTFERSVLAQEMTADGLVCPSGVFRLDDVRQPHRDTREQRLSELNRFRGTASAALSACENSGLRARCTIAADCLPGCVPLRTALANRAGIAWTTEGTPDLASMERATALVGTVLAESARVLAHGQWLSVCSEFFLRIVSRTASAGDQRWHRSSGTVLRRRRPGKRHLDPVHTGCGGLAFWTVSRPRPAGWRCLHYPCDRSSEHLGLVLERKRTTAGSGS